MGRTLLWIVVAAALGAGGWFLFGGGAGDDAGGYDEVELVDGEAGEGEAGPGLKGAGGTTRPAPTEQGPTPYAIRGRVVDEHGTAVPGVEVIARYEGRARDPSNPAGWAPTLEESIETVIKRTEQTPDQQRPIVARTTADGDGRFELRFARFARYRVSALPDAPAIGAFTSLSLHEGKEEIDTVLKVYDGTPLHGRVVDTDGKPVQASLHASRFGMTDGVYMSWSHGPATTDAEGGWRFEAVPFGGVRLELRLGDGRRVSGLNVQTPRDEPYVIEVAGGDASVTGLVTDAAATPVSGAIVVVQVGRAKAKGKDEAKDGTSPRIAVRATSGPDGRYTVAGLPAGTITAVEAVSPGFLPYAKRAGSGGFEAVPLEAGAAATHDVVLNRGGTVIGVVREAGTDKPIANATVTLTRRQGSVAGPTSAAPSSVTTDADGRYRIEHVGQGAYVALPEAEGYFLPQLKASRGDGMAFEVSMAGAGGAPQALTVVMTAEGKEVVRDLELGKGFSVKGKVVDAKGKGIGGAEVRARGYGLQQLAWAWGIGGRQNKALTTSRGDGSFTVEGLPPRAAWTLFARKEGFAGVFAEPFALGAETAPTDLVLKLEKGAVLRGRVEGLEPAELTNAQVGFWGQGQELAFQSYNHKVKPDGTFEITSVPPGDWTLNIWASGRQGAQKPISGVKAGEVREDIVLEFAAGVDVTGRITDPDGDPIANLSIMLNTMGRGGWSSTNTDSDGRFHFRNVSKGNVQVVTWGTNGQQTPLGKRFQAPATGVELTYAKPTLRTIRGEVQAADGTPIAVVHVTITGGGRPRGGMMPAPAMPGHGAQEAINGAFEIRVSGDGPWAVVATNARGEDGTRLNLKDARQTVKDPAAKVIVRMEAGARIAGRVLDEKGKGLADVSVTAGSRGAKTDKHGAFEIDGLPDTQLLVQVNPPTGLVRPQPQTVKPGTTDVEFRLVQGLSIQGTAFDPEGKPLAQGYASANWPKTGTTPQGASGAQLRPGGTFELVGIPPGVRVRLQVQVWSASGAVAYAPAVVENVEPGTTGIEVRLGGGLTIEGKILDHEGKPVEQCYIYGRTKDGKRQTGWVQVGEGGTFRLGGLDETEYELRVMRQDGGATPPPVGITPPASGVEIRLPRTVSFGGRIEGLGNDSGQGWRIRVWTADGKQVASTNALADGFWEIPAIAELSEVWVGASKRGDDRYARSGPMKSNATGVVLRLQAGKTISGTIEGAVENDRVRAAVWAEGADGWMTTGSIEKDGSWVIQGVPPGTYVVKARAYGMEPKQTDVTNIRDGASGVKLDLR